MDFSAITYHFILPMLEYFDKLLGNHGWAIIAVTIIVKAILYPLTQKQTESMKSMQALQPKVKMLQDRFNKQKERYKDRPAKLKEIQAEFQKDMMEFYQSNKVNPLGGCLPMLIQLPILIALFWAFNGAPFKPVSVSTPAHILSEAKSLDETRNGSSKSQIYVDGMGSKGRFILNPGEVKIPVGKEIVYMIVNKEGDINDVSKIVKWEILDTPYYVPNYINKEDISKIATLEINKENNSAKIIPKKEGKFYIHAVLPAASEDEKFLFISGLGKTGLIDYKTKKINFDVLVLVILFVFTIWLSGKVTASTSPPPSDPKQAEMQKTMQTMMPPMVGVMMLMFPVPAGVLLYFVASGLIQALQTWMVMKDPASKSISKEENKITTAV